MKKSVKGAVKNNGSTTKAATKTPPSVETPKLDMYEVITNRIIERLEQGELTWRKTWNGYGLAKNYCTGKVYKGINMLMMNLFVSHPLPYYMTFKQAAEKGGRIRKGAKAEQVIYFNVVFKDENDQTITSEVANQMHRAGQKIKVLKFLKYFSVFNVADIEGIELIFDDIKLQPNEKIERCEKVINQFPNPPQYISEDKGSAFYRPSDDTLNMPPIEQHDNSEFYYATFFHELIHATGHQKRLSREEVINPNTFGSIPYSEEELVAELGASFLCGLTGIDQEPVIENAAAYIQGWLSKLRNDKQLIFKAAAAAQKAVDYIVGIDFDETEA